MKEIILTFRGSAREMHMVLERVIATGNAVEKAPKVGKRGKRRLSCRKCDRLFTTTTGRGIHESRKHGMHSPRYEVMKAWHAARKTKSTDNFFVSPRGAVRVPVSSV